MQDSTPQGDSAIEVRNVDTAAQALLARRNARQSDQPTENAEIPDEVIDDEPEENPQEVEAEEVSEAEAEEVTEEAEEPDRDGADRFETVAELAEATGMDLDEFMDNIKVAAKVDGEEQIVSLAALQKGFQLESDYTRKTKALHEQQRAFDAKLQQEQQAMAQQHQQLAQYLQVAQNELMNEFKGVDWNKLQEESPDKYVLLRQKYGERQAQIEQVQRQGQELLQQQLAQQEQAQMQQREQFVAEQEKQLLDKVKEWKDPKVREAERVQVAEFLSDMGFTQDELSNLADHRLVVMARMAMQGNKSAKDVNLAKKRIRKAPKLVKGGAGLDKNQRSAKRTVKAVQKAKATGRTEDIAAALLAKRRK